MNEISVGSDGLPRCGFMTMQRAGTITLRWRGLPLSRVVESLEARLQRPVVNDTKLTGMYDVDLTTAAGNPNAVAPTTDAPSSLETAVSEQLGLRLQAAQGPVEVVLITSATMPSPD